ncbi:MmcQ/YjbR family DNA-binding protein [Edaphobacter sp. HDX4]|uniref:MmcQ/YjbR family DNA-binding protein n=1 Tax=Edaphobacter sp. HDX4 TaxID=2794064 RepID=UPI002FE56EB4
MSLTQLHPLGNSEHLGRVRRLCSALPGASEKLSHGEPTFFVDRKVFAMFANNHHHDGHIAVWVPAESGAQQSLIRTAPKTYFKPPYVGVRGWVGIELAEIDDEGLALHLVRAWRHCATGKLQSMLDARAV